MPKSSWNAIRQQVYTRAQGCCEYCRTCEANIGQAMHIEHIDPAGGDTLDNLCLACSSCNLSKAKATTANDPETGFQTRLFNPRTDSWADHFGWMYSGLWLHGKTPIGRSTILRLRMNQERVLIARRKWIAGGFHPPE